MTFHDILPAHAITTSPTKTSTTSRLGLRAPASNHLRTQSTRVPSPSQAANGLHMRSKSAPNESVRSRNHHGTHSHPRDTHRQHDAHAHPRDARQSHNHRGQGDATSPRKNASKSGFSLSSTLQSISRSLTTICRTNPRRRSGNDAKDSYIHL